jgi:D-alanine-D-alanine ligase-like ATP-grasp enzyme
MARKIRVGIFFGGRSAEHEVSLQSAKNRSTLSIRINTNWLLIANPTIHRSRV